MGRDSVIQDRWIRQDFTFFGNGRGATDAANALRQLGFDPVVVDEEVSGDGYWHVAAFKVTRLDKEELGRLRRSLTDVAERFGGEYIGWKFAQRGDGSFPDPSRPLM
jgi:Regulator of ribonuclease activity B